jgi:hypothetical protein
MDNKQQNSNMVPTLQFGDLVRHKHLGGVGIITGEKTVVSNITMGLVRKFTVEWISSTLPLLNADYYPALLEPVAPTDKNCPPK